VQALASAREIGLSDEWRKSSPSRTPQRQALTVVRMVAVHRHQNAPTGDLVLAIDGKV